jgi:hypothetical protein
MTILLKDDPGPEDVPATGGDGGLFVRLWLFDTRAMEGL